MKREVNKYPSGQQTGDVFRCLRASYYKVGLYNIIVKGYPGVLVPVKKG